jgi:hypothetical protein
MNTAEQVEAIRARMEQEGAARPDIIRQVALACIGWPYVFGAWGEECTPSNRKRRAREDHPTIRTKCRVLSGKGSDCTGCQWYPQAERVRMYDCRGFTAWLVRQVGLDLTGQGATSQYKTAANWSQRGRIADGMPDVVCCLFRQKGSTMEHTGMHIGGGVVVDCSVNVRSGGMSGWTHYAVPVGLYSEGEMPVENVKPTLRKGDSGPAVIEVQEILTQCGYNPGSVDGKFGTNTRNAVIAFQTSENLDPDGIVGRKTWDALARAEACAPIAPGDPMTYKVTCYGMRWEQVQQIREVCPTADIQKE